MNLDVLKKSSKSPAEGDIFAFHPPGDLFYFGRVISTAAKIGPMEGCILVYLYRAQSLEKRKIPPLLRSALMVPPLMTNKLPWSKGYFENVSHEEITKFDVLPQHAFRDVRGLLFDEHSEPATGTYEVIGEFGLQSYRTIDDQVSRALGIPLSA